MLAFMNAPARAKRSSIVPQRKTGRPEDIAEAAAFLCAPAAGYVSGIVAMALAVMPWRAVSRAIVRVSPTMRALAAT